MDLDDIREIQENEIEALKAIFMDDYRQVVNQTPWKACFVVLDAYMSMFANCILGWEIGSQYSTRVYLTFGTIGR